jgi:hypothetical protein
MDGRYHPILISLTETVVKGNRITVWTPRTCAWRMPSAPGSTRTTGRAAADWSRSHEAVAPANVEERAAGGKLPEHSEETGVAMSEPEEGMLFPATIV